MPDSKWDEMLAAAAGEVLETMFFTPVYGPAPAGASVSGPRMAARISFQGTPSGVLILSVPEPAARALAANFLASEGDDPLPVSQLRGVVSELANMVCGSLLSRVESEEHFRLSSPELLAEGAVFPPGQPNQSLAVSEDEGDGAIDLWLALEHYVN